MHKEDLHTLRLFDLSRSLAGEYLEQFEYPWQALEGIGDFIRSLGPALNKDVYREIAPQVWVHSSARIAPSAFLGAPCIIGADTEIRHCAFIRENALVGDGCVVGNSVEIKNAILFDCAQVPHFNYVGDSILGYKAHMGAGSITSNVKQDMSDVTVRCGNEKIETGLMKFGAMLGDCVEVGCNSVLNPGTVVGKNSNIYPLSCVRGAVPANSILKSGGEITPKR